jgi:DNA-binding MarR family transcriptional regulator
MAKADWEKTVELMRRDPAEMGAEPANAARLLLRLASAQLQYVGQLRGFLGVTLSELYALLALWDGGRCSMSDLAERVDMSRAAITTLADRIEAAGYVERTPDPTDRRRVLLGVTPKFEQSIAKYNGDLTAHATAVAKASSDWAGTATDIAALRVALLEDAETLRSQAPRRSRGRTAVEVPTDDPSSYW